MHGAVGAVAAVLWAEWAAEIACVFIEEFNDFGECDLIGVFAESVAASGAWGAGDEIGGGEYGEDFCDDGLREFAVGSDGERGDGKVEVVMVREIAHGGECGTG